MRVVRRINEEQLSMLRWIDGSVLTGEDTMLRVGRSGYALTYLSLPRAEWRVYEPPTSCRPEYVIHLTEAAVFAAFEDEVMIGLACIQCHEQCWGDILDIRVDASKRRSGVATMLLDACTRFAQSRNMRGLRIMASEYNPSLCQFCEHTGFSLQGIDRMALIYTESERVKPLARRACALYFYRMFDKD